jgi:hypothetical protein
MTSVSAHVTCTRATILMVSFSSYKKITQKLYFTLTVDLLSIDTLHQQFVSVTGEDGSNKTL